MKRLLIFILLFPAVCLAQVQKDSLKWLKDTIALPRLPIDSTGSIAYKLIDKTPGISKGELYNRAKIWAALAFNSAKNVTQLEDKETGSIVIKAISRQTYTFRNWGTDYPISYYLHFSMQFTAKDDRYRIVVSGFSIETEASLYSASRTYALEDNYKMLKEWNGNAKVGNMAFNRSIDLSPKAIRPQFTIINNLNDFALATIQDAKAALSKPAKADDF